ncbi:MAG: efflux RND transporter periplasmic adaptor subunit [Oscillatoria sp. Prado101]|nr:efflux RND transporter periplasmic adaptor subunit [Oscillatoria sp. Prado101]
MGYRAFTEEAEPVELIEVRALGVKAHEPVECAAAAPAQNTADLDVGTEAAGEEPELAPAQEGDAKSLGWLTGGRGVILGLALGAAVTAAGMRFMPNASTPPAAKAPPSAALASGKPAASQTVTVAPVTTASVSRTLSATGTVFAHDLLPVLPKATGLQIKQVLVDEGDAVQEGQVLAILDDSVIQTQIDQAKAGVESASSAVQQKEAAVGQAQASLEQARASVSEAQASLIQEQAGLTEAEAGLAEARANLARAKANLEQALRERDRAQQLADQGAISRQELETRLTETQNAQEAVRVAEANISRAESRIASARANIARALAKVSSSEASLNSAKASVRSAEANVSTASADVRNSSARVKQVQTQLEQTKVIAPASGIVAERIARVGDVTGGGQKLFSIIRSGRLELQAEVPETQLSSVRPGAAVRISSDADSRIEMQGTVREIAPTVDAKNRIATVKIDLPASDFIKAGMFLRAAITTATAQGLTVPAKALLPQADGSAIVYILDVEDRVRAKPVEVGEIVGSAGGDLSKAKVEIKSGLTSGDRVVVAGAGYLKDGDTVKVVSEGDVKPSSK